MKDTSTKKTYTAPTLEIIEFECEDVITTSNLKTNNYKSAGTLDCKVWGN